MKKISKLFYRGNNKRFKLSNLFYNNTFLAVFSLVMAFLIWGVVTVEFTPDETEVKTITASVDSSDLEDIEKAYGLKSYGEASTDVKIEISGKRYIVQSDDVSSYITWSTDLSSVNHTGTYELAITPHVSDNSGIEIESYSNNTVSLYFDVDNVKNCDVEINLTGDYKAEDGFVIGEPTTKYSRVKIKGPDSELEKIDHLQINVNVDGSLNETKTFTNQKMEFCYAEGKNSDMVDDTYLTICNYNSVDDIINVDNITVTVPVYTIKPLATSVEFTGMPENFSADNISFTVSPAVVSAGVQKSESVDTYLIKTIDYSMLKEGTNKFEIPADETEASKGIVLQDKVDVYTITVTVKNVSESTFQVAGSIATDDIDNVTAVPNFAKITIVGPAESVSYDLTMLGIDESALPTDENGNLIDGTYNDIPVIFTNPDCWAYAPEGLTATVTIG